MSIYPRSGARELQKLPSSKYYNVQKRESWFALGFDAAKNTHSVSPDFFLKIRIS